MRYVERHRPLMILFENVDAMDDVSLGIAHVHVFYSTKNIPCSLKPTQIFTT